MAAPGFPVPPTHFLLITTSSLSHFSTTICVHASNFKEINSADVYFVEFNRGRSVIYYFVIGSTFLIEFQKVLLVCFDRQMTIEVRLADMSKSIRKKKCNRKSSSKMKRSPPSPAAISFPLQRLYMSCIDVFQGVGTVPSPTDVQKLCHILDGMMAEDVGLNRNLQFFKARSIVGVTPKVACTTIYQCEKFSLCIFFLPANAVIPLHNHPGMTVFNKLLLGKVHIKAYDLVSPGNSDDTISPSQPKLASLKADDVFTAPCDASVLYPTSGGNIHAFTAITPCAILDVMGPPYSKKDGRDCSYYRDIPYTALPYEQGIMSGEESERYWWLEEIEVPKESEMEGIEYMGPQIIEISS